MSCGVPSLGPGDSLGLARLSSRFFPAWTVHAGLDPRGVEMPRHADHAQSLAFGGATEDVPRLFWRRKEEELVQGKQGKEFLATFGGVLLGVLEFISPVLEPR